MARARKGLSQRQAAAILDCSQPRVASLKKSNRIRTLEDGSLCAASVRALQKELSARTGASDNPGPQSDNPSGRGYRPREIEQIDPAGPPDEFTGIPEEWAGITVVEAIRRKEIGAAWKQMLAVQKEAGLLVSVEATQASWIKTLTAVRERILAIPTKAGARLGLSAEQQTTLEDLVTDALAELSATGE
ncbi:MAG: hypothetical protein AAF416_18085 [Pseudomonadota bacterium]